MPRPLPRRIAPGAPGDLRDLSFDPYNLENTCEGWLYNEEGASIVISTIYAKNDVTAHSHCN
jgi:hypothetical protein